MNNYFIYGLLYLFTGLNPEMTPQQQITDEVAEQVTPSAPTYFSDDLVYNDELYTVILRVDKQKNGEHMMTIEMQLKNDAYYVSPNAKRDFSGRFTIVWTKAHHVKIDKSLTEIPLSLEEFDPHPFVNGPVNWVRVNTTYKQSLKVLSDKDFEVLGYLQFTIEPRCTLEKIPFVLSFEKGRLVAKLDGC